MTEFIKSFEELDTAVVVALSKSVVRGKTVKATYYTPDVDIQKLTLPAIAVYRTNPMRDLSRWSNDEEFVDDRVYDEDGKLISVSRRIAPEPWSIIYTAKTLYGSQMDGVSLNNQLLRLFPRGSYLTIKGVDYAIEQTTAGLWGSQYKDFGKAEEGERRFQETYAFKIDFYLEVDTPKPSKVVQEIGVRTIPQN